MPVEILIIMSRSGSVSINDSKAEIRTNSVLSVSRLYSVNIISGPRSQQLAHIIHPVVYSKSYRAVSRKLYAGFKSEFRKTSVKSRL